MLHSAPHPFIVEASPIIFSHSLLCLFLVFSFRILKSQPLGFLFYFLTLDLSPFSDIICVSTSTCDFWYCTLNMIPDLII